MKYAAKKSVVVTLVFCMSLATAFAQPQKEEPPDIPIAWQLQIGNVKIYDKLSDILVYRVHYWRENPLMMMYEGESRFAIALFDTSEGPPKWFTWEANGPDIEEGLGMIDGSSVDEITVDTLEFTGSGKPELVIRYRMSSAHMGGGTFIQVWDLDSYRCLLEIWSEASEEYDFAVQCDCELPVQLAEGALIIGLAKCRIEEDSDGCCIPPCPPPPGKYFFSQNGWVKE